jgi:hypothetical protein
VKLVSDEENQGCIFDERGFISDEVATFALGASREDVPGGCAT